jgi:protein-glutamine gamma-glutamyltransferase
MTLQALTATAVRLTLVAFAISVLLHVDHLPLWCTGAVAVSLGWQALHQYRKTPLPAPWLRVTLTLLLFAGTLTTFRTLNGLSPGSALLVVMGAAKLLELRARRDAVVIVVVTLLLILAACLDRQSLVRLPLYAGATWTACAALAALGTRQWQSAARGAFRLSGRALLWGLPFAVLCFVLVPRLPNAMWSLPASDQAQTGLDDKMSPGSISDLSMSDEPAFRVRFDGAIPSPSERYWRGPVLHDFDGYTWRRVQGQTAMGQPVEETGPRLRYHVMLEPHGRNWLYGLDSIRNVESQRVFISFDGQVMRFQPVTSALSYDATSVIHLRAISPLSATGRKLDTQLVSGRNPRSVALARDLRSQSTDDRSYAGKVLDYFRSGGFEYTLTPPLLNFDSIDDLLFNTRRGFCGHFASAYVTLMRAAGVPARVVTGYLGGEWNPIGGYYIIRQSDAHAWAEIWLEGQGWTRVDPTAVVSPERLQRGLRDLLPESGSAIARVLRRSPLLSGLLERWDAANSWWRERIVNYDLARQLDLLRKLGLADIDFRGMALLLLAGGTLWMLGALYWMSRRPGQARPDITGRLWLKYQALLRRRGLTIAVHEAPRSLEQRVARMLPDSAAEVEAFTDLYLRMRYGPTEVDAADVQQLKERLRRVVRRIPRRPAGARGLSTAGTRH